MFITFLRHATAEDRSLAVPDAERALTDKGEKQAKRLAAFCQAAGLMPGALYSSPLLRAHQTAKILQERLPGCPHIQTLNWLSNTSPQTMVAELSKLADMGMNDVWLVGHEPDFSGVIGRLLHTDCDNIVIKKASLTHLDADFTVQPSAKLLWSIPCSLMP